MRIFLAALLLPLVAVADGINGPYPQAPTTDGSGVPVFSQRAGNQDHYNSVSADDASIAVRAVPGGGIGLSVPGGAATQGNFDTAFTSHSPAGNFHSQSQRGNVALADTTNQNIQSVTITTPWPADSNELKAGIDIRLRGRLATTATPADAQLLFVSGTLRVDREGGSYIDGTPSYAGQLAAGTKMQIGTIGGFIAAQITFRAGAFAREVYCSAGGISYSQANTDQSFTVAANIGTPPALTGPTDVFGASGLLAVTVTGTTTTTVAPQAENRGGILYMTGQVTKSGNWANLTTLFTLPAPQRPRTQRIRAMSAITAGFAFILCTVTFNTDGTVTLATGTAANTIYLDTLTGLDLASF